MLRFAASAGVNLVENVPGKVLEAEMTPFVKCNNELDGRHYWDFWLIALLGANGSGQLGVCRQEKVDACRFGSPQMEGVGKLIQLTLGAGLDARRLLQPLEVWMIETAQEGESMLRGGLPPISYDSSVLDGILDHSNGGATKPAARVLPDPSTVKFEQHLGVRNQLDSTSTP